MWKSVVAATLLTAALVLFIHHYSGTTTPANPQVPAASLNLALLRVKAEQGEAASQTQLGRLYAQGESVSQDYRLAANQNHPGAQYNLGHLYAQGSGVAADQTQAVQWIRRAAEQGDSLAQFDLGRHYAQGAGVPRDTVEACKWMLLARSIPDATVEYARYKARLAPAEIREAKRRAAAFAPQPLRP